MCIILLAAAVCVPVVLFTHYRLMPDADELPTGLCLQSNGLMTPIRGLLSTCV